MFTFSDFESSTICNGEFQLPRTRDQGVIEAYHRFVLLSVAVLPATGALSTSGSGRLSVFFNNKVCWSISTNNLCDIHIYRSLYGIVSSALLLRCLCEMIDEAINKALREAEESANNSEAATGEESATKDEKKKRFLPPFIYNSFSLLAYLVCQPGGKASFLNLVTTTTSCISEYVLFISNIISVQSKESDWFYLENCLLPLVQSVCDHELCLSNFNGMFKIHLWK